MRDDLRLRLEISYREAFFPVGFSVLFGCPLPLAISFRKLLLM